MKRLTTWRALLAAVAAAVLAGIQDIAAAPADEFADDRPPPGLTVASADGAGAANGRRASGEAVTGAREPPVYLLALAGVLVVAHIAVRRRPGAADRGR